MRKKTQIAAPWALLLIYMTTCPRVVMDYKYMNMDDLQSMMAISLIVKFVVGVFSGYVKGLAGGDGAFYCVVHQGNETAGCSLQ
jgi:hypothetical protein